MKLEGIHHITAITGDAPAQRRLLHARPRPAARQEERQPGRPDRLPPLLRRRARQRRLGPDVLRVPGRRARARRARDGAPDRLARRAPRTRSPSGPSGSPTRACRSAGRVRASCASPTPRGSSTSSSSTTSGDEPLIAEHPEVPAEHALRGFDGVRAYAAGRRAQPRAARAGARLRARRATAGRSAAPRAAAPTPTTRRRTQRRHPGRGHGPPRRLGVAARRARGVARARSCARAGARRR